MTKRKHLFWFDIYLTYDELGFLNKKAQEMKLSHMDYLAHLLRKEMEAKQ